jgi:CCR4-NOT transcriptional complex subunit CAF120
LDFVERTDSPPLNDNPHSAEPSPVPPRNGSTFGPPLRTPIISPPSPIDEEYGSQVSQQPSLHRSGDATAQTSVSSLPSSFAKNKRGEERVLAAAVAQQAQQQALSRPGRSKGQGKQRAWVDSDEDTVEDEESEEEEAEMDAATRQRMSRMPTPPNGLSQEQYYASQQGRQSYYDNGHQSPQLAPQPDEPSPNRTRPFVNPNGLLHAGIIEKEERSARALENEARVNGGPLVSIPSKPPPPQTGLVGAITSHQRDKERTGGVGRALTEQQREKKLAEQRQRQLDDFQRQQLVQQQQQQQMMMQQHAQMQQYGGGYQNPMMMMNPWMMGGMGGMGGMGYGGMPMAPQGSSPMGMSPPGSVMGAPGTPQPPASPAPGGQGHQLSPSQSMQMDPVSLTSCPPPSHTDATLHQMMMQQQVFQQQAMMAAQQAYAQGSSRRLLPSNLS